METGKTGRYFKYAIGEIVLVVIGILIALSINNWNENRKKNIAEKEFIEGVKNDLIQDKKYILDVIEELEPKIEVYKTLNNVNSPSSITENITLDSLLAVYYTSQRTFYPISGSYQSAIAGNEINTLNNKSLTNSIIKLYNSTYSRLIDNGEILDGRWNHLTQKYSHNRRIGHFPELNTYQFSELLDDMYHHFIQMEWYQNILIDTIEEIDELLKKMK